MFFYKSDTHHKKIRKGIGLALILSFLLSIIPQPALAANDNAGFFSMFSGSERSDDSAAEPVRGGTNPKKNYGDFTNVSNSVVIDPESADDCQRTMSGVMDFDWPETRDFNDVVVIYDLDAPSAAAREVMKDVVRNIAGQMELEKDIDDKSPKDRIMAVYYGGNQGRVKLGHEGKRDTYVESYLDSLNVRHKLKATGLYSEEDDIDELIQSFLIESNAQEYYENHFSAPLPAMIKAKEEYQKKTKDKKAYNNSTYTVNGQRRTRKTIYVLMSNAVPAVAPYKQLSQQDRNWIDKHPIAIGHILWDDRAYAWYQDIREDYADGFYHSTSEEDSYNGSQLYKMILRNMEERAADIIDNGGLDNGAAELITAFYEDERVMSREFKGYGDGWNRYIRPALMATYEGMQNAGFVTVNSDLSKYTQEMQQLFVKKYDPTQNRIEIDVPSGVRTFSFRLKKINADGSLGGEVDTGVLSKTEGRKTTVSMAGIPAGRYRLTYQIIETEHKPEAYYPAQVHMFYNDESGEGTLIGDKDSGENYYQIEGNPRTDCGLTLTKMVAEKDNLSDANPTKEITYRHGTFNYATRVRFSAAINNAQSVKFIDDVSEQLDVVDKWMMKEIDGNWQKVEGEALDALGRFEENSGNTVTFSFKKRDNGDGTSSYVPYNNERYALVVKARIKRELPDSTISGMREMLADGSSRIGVANTAKIIVDNKDKYESSVARAIPPALERATLTKSASLIGDDGEPIAWNNLRLTLPTKDDPFLLRFRIKLPDDVSGFKNAFVDDYLDPALEVVEDADGNPEKPRLFIGDVEFTNTPEFEHFHFNRDGSQWLLPPNTNDDNKPENTNTTDGQKLHLVFFDHKLDDSLFSQLVGKEADILVKVRIKKDASLSDYYDSAINRLVIENNATVSTNSRDPYTSNTVNIMPSMPSVTLVKKAADSSGAVLKTDGKDVLLPGAVFTLSGGGSASRNVTTRENGTVVIDRLVPGRSYTLKETTPPSGYQKSDAIWTINVSDAGAITVKNENALSTESYDEESKTITAINRQPAAVIPDKMVKVGNGDYEHAHANSPLHVAAYDEPISYRIKVPLGEDTAAYNTIFLTDTLDDLLLLDPNSVSIYALDKGIDPDTATDEDKMTGLVVGRTIGAHKLTLHRTGDFSRVKNKDIYIEYTATLQKDFTTLFNDEHKGIVKNRVDFTVNDMPKHTDVTHLSYTDGAVTLLKQIKKHKPGGEPGEYQDESDLEDNQTAAFALYKVNGVADLDPDRPADDPRDRYIETYSLSGDGSKKASTLSVNHLEPGDYYFSETQAPSGYSSNPGMIPQNGFTVDNDGNATVDDTAISAENPIKVVNLEAGTPTIRKFVKPKGADNTAYSAETLDLPPAGEFSFAVIVKIPEAPTGTVDYVVIDDLPDFADISNFRGSVKESGDFGEGWSADQTVKSWIEQPIPTIEVEENGETIKRKRIKAVIPKDKVQAYKGKEVAFGFDVKAQEGSDALITNVLNTNGVYTNTATVRWGKSDDSVAAASVSVRPTITRNINFTKMFGETPQDFRGFVLYRTEMEKDGEPVAITADTPLTNDMIATDAYGNSLLTHSKNGGQVSFDNVPAGSYWLVEAPPFAGSPNTFLFYDRLKVKVNGEAITDDQDGAVSYFTPDGTLLENKADGTIWNNEAVDITVAKKWAGEEGNVTFRPKAVTYELWRKDNDGANEQKVAEETVAVAADGSAPVTFSNPQGLKEQERKLVKYDSKNKPYIYEIREQPVKTYTATVEKNKTNPYDFTVTNTLDTLDTLSFKKVDMAGEPIEGRKFVMVDSVSGATQRHISDENGDMAFGSMKRNATYILQENAAADGKYIYQPEKSFVVTRDAEGNTTFKPTLEQEENGTFLIRNNKIPLPVKSLHSKDGETNIKKTGEHTYLITDLTKPFDMSVDVPIGSLLDMDQLYISDTLKPGITMVPDSARIEVRKNDRTYDLTACPDLVRKDFDEGAGGFYIDIADNGEKTVPEADMTLSQLLENSTLHVSFTLKVNYDTKTFKENYPDGYENTAQLRINKIAQTDDRYYNNVESNTVNLKLRDTSVHFTKTLAALPDGTTPTLENAVFTLFKEGRDAPYATAAAHDDGVISFAGVDDGVYRIEETKAPYGYVPMAPLRFKVITDENGTQKVVKLTPAGEDEPDVETEVNEGNLGEIKNIPAASPTVQKFASKAGEDGEPDKVYVMDNRQEEFDYHVIVTIPEDVTAYEDLVIQDEFQDTLKITDTSYRLKVTDGAETLYNDTVTPESDSTTKDIAFDANDGTVHVNDTITYTSKDQGASEFYTFKWHVKDQPSFDALAGKTLHFTFKASIWPKYQNVDDIGKYFPDSDGNLPNTAEVYLNKTKVASANTQVKPSDKFGLTFKKVVTTGTVDYPAYGATFTLAREDDGDLPAGVPTTYTTDNSGTFSIPMKLDKGKYILRETKVPDGYVKEGKTVDGVFVRSCDHYSIELQNDATGKKVATVTAVCPINGNKILTADEDGVFTLDNKPITTVTVNKIWQDTDNELDIRPAAVNLIIQRRVIKDGADTINPDGSITAVGAKDSYDETFNDAMKEKKITVPVKNFPYVAQSPADGSHPFLKYDDEGNRYDYYAIETDVDPNYVVAGYESAEDSEIITNKMKAVDFKVKKVDDSAEPKALKGAIFNISHDKSDDTTVTRTLMTDENGEILIDFLPRNKIYKLQEIKAPAGHKKDNTVYTIVTDDNAVPAVYTSYIDETTNTPAERYDGESHTLTVIDAQETVPEPIKTALVTTNTGSETGNNLNNLETDTITYTVKVPIRSLQGQTLNDIVLKDTLHKYLVFDGHDAQVVLKIGDTSVSAEKLTINVTEPSNDEVGPTLEVKVNDPSVISGETATLTFKAKVKPGTTAANLKAAAGDKGIANTVTLTVNGKSNESKPAYVVPGKTGAAPTLSKTVYNAKEEGVGDESAIHYHMVTKDETVRYIVKADVPEGVLGYNHLIITDVMNNAMKIKGGGFTLRAVEKDSTAATSENLIGKPGVSIGNTSNSDGDTVITVAFDNTFDYSAIAGKVILLEYDASIRADVSDEEWAQLVYAAKNEIRIPNTAKLYFNKTEITPDNADQTVNVTVTPPEKPTIKKEVSLSENGMDYNEYEPEQTASLAQISHSPNYRITLAVPHNLNGIDTIAVQDVLQPVHDVRSVTILSKGEDDADFSEDDSLSAIVSDDKNILLALTGKETLKSYAGKTIQIVIQTKPNPGANPRDSLNENGKLVNTAELFVNGKSLQESDATITTQLATLHLTKTLDGSTDWPEHEKAVFELYKVWNGEEFKIEDITIASTAPVSVGHLLVGQYILREVKTPKGFVKGADTAFTIGDKEVEKTLEVINAKKPTISKTVNKGCLTPSAEDTVTYTISVPLKATDGIESIEVKDILPEPLETVGVPQVTFNDKAFSDYTPLKGGKVGFVIGKNAVDNVKNGTLKLIINAKLKDGFTYDDLTADMKADGIPNTAGLTVNGETTESEPVYVKVPVANVTLTKTAEGNALPAGTASTFELYREKVGDEEADVLLGSYQTHKNGEGKHSITVPNLLPGNYYFVEKEAPAGYVLDASKRAFTIAVDESGKAVATPTGDNFTDFTVDNKKSAIPTPVKKVKEKDADSFSDDALDLSAGKDTVTYQIEVPVDKVDGWTTFVLKDTVDDQLTVDASSLSASVKDNEGTVTALDTVPTYIADERLITFRYDNLDKVKALVGKTVILTFDARINDLTAFLAAHPDGTVGNTATLTVSDKLQAPSNTVTVTVPAQLPAPVKTVDGDDQGNSADNTTTKVLGAKTQPVTYDIRQAIPENITGLTSVTLEDELKDVFAAPQDENVTVYLGDQKRADWAGKIEISQQTVRLNLNQTDLKAAKGKIVRLEIKTALRENADFTSPGYLNQGNVVVANQAKRCVNGETTEPTLSNVVNITPPGDEPTITKEIVGGNNGNKLLDAKDAEFTYVVSTTIPQNVQGYDTVTISDVLPAELDVIEASAAGFTPVRDGQTVTLSITPAADHVGKTIDLKIKARIKDSATLDDIAREYQDSAIPNTATLNWGDKSISSGTVTVTPPGTAPGVKKTVNGKTAETLNNIDEPFVYNITFAIPSNVAGFNKLTLSDALDPAIDVVEESGAAKVAVYVNEEKDDALTGNVAVESTDDRTQLTLAIEKGFFSNGFKHLAGKTVRVEVEAKLKDSVNTAEAIANIASLQLNDETPKTSDPVTVTAPKGSVILTKVVDGEPLSGEQTATFKLYRQQGDAPAMTDALMPINGHDSATVNAAKNRIAVSGLEPGSYYFKETAAPDGYILNDAPVPFTIERGQVQPEILTWNNSSELTPVKTVNDAKHVELAEYGEDLTFAVDVPVGNIAALRSFIIEDELNDLFTYVQDSAVVKAGDTVLANNDTNADSLAFSHGKLTFAATPEQLAQMKNSNVRLTFKATLKDGITAAEVKALKDGVISNTAALKVNGKSKSSNPVTVKPLLGSIELTKTADGKALSAEQTATFDLYKGAEATEANKIGSKTTENGKITVNDLIPGTYTFVETAAPKGYRLDTTPQTVTVKGGQTAKRSVNNSSAAIPTPSKEISTTTIGDLTDTVTYTIRLPLANTDGIESLVITDKVDDLLTIVNDEHNEPTVNIEGAEVHVQGDTVTYTMSEADLVAYKEAGLSEIVLRFDVKLADGVTAQQILDAYGAKGIPNQATVTTNGNDRHTNVVYLSANLGSAKLTKTIDGGQPLPQGVSATFELFRTDGSQDVLVQEATATDASGVVEARDLPNGSYKWVETEPPTGYQAAADATFTISDDAKTSNLTVDNKPKTTMVKAEKVWDGGSERPDIQVQLFREADGVGKTYVGDAVTLTNAQWTHSWPDLPTHTGDGKPYTYTVDELNVPAGYSKAITNRQDGADKDIANDFIITNTYGSEKKDVTAYKVWDGGPASKPTVTLELWRTNHQSGDTAIDEKVPSSEKNPVDLADGTISHTWKNLDMTDGDGNAYTYYVKETKIGDTALAENDTTAENYTKAENGLTVTNTYKSPTRSVYAQKAWVNGDSTNRPDVTFSLYRNGVKVDGQEKAIPAGSGDVVEWQHLDANDKYGQAYHYEVKETTVPDNYILGDTTGEGTQDNPFIITNTYKSGVTNYTVEKKWENGGNKQPPIQVTLYRQVEGGDPEMVPGIDPDGPIAPGTITNPVAVVGSHTWTDLPQNDEQTGKPYIYSVKETKIDGIPVENNKAGNYTVSYEVNPEGTTNKTLITNTYKSPTITVSGTKTWKGDQEADRPESITVELLQNGEPFASKPKTVTTNAAQNWAYSFDVPKTDADGNAYTYTVKESAVPDGYEAGTNGMDITNTYVGTVELKITKMWQDDNNAGNTRPEKITLQAVQMKDGKATGKTFDKVVEVQTGESATYTIDSLPKYDSDKTPFTYKADEVDVAGYEKSIDETTITNTLIGTGELKITKMWQDDNNAGNTRPERITLQAIQMKDGKATEKTFDKVVEVQAGESATYTIDKLPKYDSDKTPFTYKANEVDVAGYDKAISDNGTDDSSYTITNTLSDSIDIAYEKVWDGGSERPKVTLQLMNGDKVVREAEIPANADGDALKGKFTDLSRYKDGKAIAYTLNEVTVDGYTTTISGDAANGFTVKNSYIVPMDGTVKAEKIWQGGSEDSRKPVNLQLFRKAEGSNKEYVGEPITLDGTADTAGETAAWHALWSGLATRTKDGKPYTYSVEELNPPAQYSVKVENRTTNSGETVANDFIVTNTYGSAKKDVTAYKKWDGGKATERPDVTFTLYRSTTGAPNDGDIVPTDALNGQKNPVTLADGTLSHTWRDLDVTDRSGKAYTYYVKEADLSDDYVAIYSDDGLTVTNTYQVKRDDITVKKDWKNGPNNKPPVKVQLYRQADGGNKELVGEPVTLNGSETPKKWQYTWKNMDLTTTDGVPYTYNVEELDTPDGYTPEVDGNAEKGFIITNTFDSKKGTVTAHKVWRGGDTANRPAIYFQLYKDGAKDGKPKQVEDTTVEWAEKDLLKANGDAINYTVQEVDADGKPWQHDNYTTTYSKDKLTVTNTYQSAQKTITVKKEWHYADDSAMAEKDISHDQVDVLLYRNGDPYKELTVKKADNWQITATVDKTDHTGKAYTYAVKELPVSGFSSKVTQSNDVFTVTNTQDEAAGKALSIVKIWEGGAPDGVTEITVNVTREPDDGFGTKAYKIRKADDWMLKIDDLESADKQNNPYTYQVTEEPVPGYDSTVKSNGSCCFTITNAPQQSAAFTVVKVDKTSGAALADAVFELRGPDDSNGAQRQVTDADGDLTFSKLSTGNYTLHELTAPQGYVASSEVRTITVDADGIVRVDDQVLAEPLVIENERIKAAVTLTKTFDGKRPQSGQSATFDLYKEGTEDPLDAYTTDENGVITVDNLEPGDYHFIETATADGYTFDKNEQYAFTVHGDLNEAAFLKVDNKRDTTDITVNKVWQGGPDNKPDVKVQLYRTYGQDKTAVGAPVVLADRNSDGNLTYTWTNQPLAPQSGGSYTYSVEEVNLDDSYTAEVSGDVKDGFTITNTYTAKTQDVSAQLIWVGGDGDRPTTWFKLYRRIDGSDPEPVPDADIKELPPGTTEVTWQEMDASDEEGNAYVYTVQQVDAEGNDATPEGYSKVEHGLIVLNIAAPESGIVLVKVDESGKTLLPGAQFELYKTDAESGISDDSSVSDNAGDDSTETTSAADSDAVAATSGAADTDGERSEQLAALEREWNDLRDRRLTLAALQDALGDRPGEDATTASTDPAEPSSNSAAADANDAEMAEQAEAVTTAGDDIEQLADERLTLLGDLRDTLQDADAGNTILDAMNRHIDAVIAKEDGLPSDDELLWLSALQQLIRNSDEAEKEPLIQDFKRYIELRAALLASAGIDAGALNDRLDELDKRIAEKEEAITALRSDVAEAAGNSDDGNLEMTLGNDKGTDETGNDPADEHPPTGGERIGDTYTTDDSGLIVVQDLTAGDYLFKETAAPDGYEIITAENTVTLDEDDDVAVLIVKNRAEKTDPPSGGDDTGEDDNTGGGDGTGGDDNTGSGDNTGGNSSDDKKDPSSDDQKTKDDQGQTDQSEKSDKKDPAQRDDKTLDATTPDDKQQDDGSTPAGPAVTDRKPDASDNPQSAQRDPDGKKTPAVTSHFNPRVSDRGSDHSNISSGRHHAPRTYDAGIAGYLLLILLAVIGMVALERRKRRNNRK